MFAHFPLKSRCETCGKNTKQHYKSRTPPGASEEAAASPPTKENEIPDKSVVKNKPDQRDTVIVMGKI